MIIPLLALCLLLPLAACQENSAQDLRLFCEAWSLQGEDALGIDAFSAEELLDSGGLRFLSVLPAGLLTLEALPGGRIHTVSFTALPDAPPQESMPAVLRMICSFTAAAPEAALARLRELGVGEGPFPGYRSVTWGDFRLVYAENDAGRYIQCARLRLLPQENDQPTLRDIPPTAVPAPQEPSSAT
jgi:hypothetical protein